MRRSIVVLTLFSLFCVAGCTEESRVEQVKEDIHKSSVFRPVGPNLIPNYEYLVGMGANISFIAPQEGMLYLVAIPSCAIIASTSTKKGEETSVSLDDDIVIDSADALGLREVSSVQLYFVPYSDLIDIDG